MTQFVIGGKTFDLSDEVISALKAKKGEGKDGPSLEALAAKHPYILAFVSKGLQMIPSGSAFKYALEIECQAGKLVESTSQYSGVDTKTPVRIDHKTAALRTFDYTGLAPCSAKMVKATSDLHQSHLCTACRTRLKALVKKVARAMVEAIGVAEELGGEG